MPPIRKMVSPILFEERFLNAGDTLELSIKTDASGFVSELLAAAGIIIQRPNQKPICLGQISDDEAYKRAAGLSKYEEKKEWVMSGPLTRRLLDFDGAGDHLPLKCAHNDALQYMMQDSIMTERAYKAMFGKTPMMAIPAIKKIISSDPVTVVIWEDDTKTIVRRAADTEPSEYTAVCAAICKKLFGSNHKLNKVIKSKIERPKKKVKKTDPEVMPEEVPTFTPFKMEPIELEVEHLEDFAIEEPVLEE